MKFNFKVMSEFIRCSIKIWQKKRSSRGQFYQTQDSVKKNFCKMTILNELVYINKKYI